MDLHGPLFNIRNLWPTPSVTPNMATSVLVLVGLWMYKNLWIKAGQAVPLR